MGYSEKVKRSRIRKQFTGYERDNESDLDFAQQESYATSLGRFTTPDPLMASGRLVDPQTWNRYAYVTNCPLPCIDPIGMFRNG
ncbi:MAG: hypothetical protein IPG22_17320 [Acidobacteria bacterium]|nr:hypothetical protein [Acidobacteriota bacterium]